MLCSQIVCTVRAPKEEEKNTNSNTKLTKFKKNILQVLGHVSSNMNPLICLEKVEKNKKMVY